MKSRDLKDLEEVLCPERGALGSPVFPDLFLRDQHQQQITAIMGPYYSSL